MENELVFIGENSEVFATSLKVAETFGKQHKHVMERIKEILTVENEAVSFFEKTSYINTRNQEQPMYLMNRDGFSLLAMGFTGQKALDFKMRYIKAFNEMEAHVKKEAERMACQLPSYQINDPIQRAKAWIKEQEEKNALVLENKSMQAEIDEKDNRLTIARTLYKEERPLVNYSKGVLAEDKLLEVHELGKMLSDIKGLEMGPKKIWNWLRDHKYIKRSSTEPYQEFINKKRYFVFKEETKRNLWDFGTHTESKTFLTPEGRVHIVNEIFKDKGIDQSKQLSLKFE